MRRPISILALIALASALLPTLFGCAHKLTGVKVGNKAPHTVLWVQGPVDTVNHLVHMYWYGTDVDGFVRSYQFKLVNPEDTVAADSAWRPTTQTDSVFSIYTPAGHAKPTLYVRAVDNLGALDPNPAAETFDFRNKAPVLTWKYVPTHPDRSDTTFASVSVTWNCSDPDGDLTKVTYRIWLDGNEATPDIITGTQAFTVPSARFLQSGVWTNGPRTLHIQAIDDGGMSSNTLATTWYVRMPVASPDYTPGHRPGRLLIIDQVPLKDLNGAANVQNFVDTIYTNTASRNLPDGTWSVLHIDNNQPFRTSGDLAQTMKLYDAVVWYRGNQDSLCTLMRNFEPGLESYLDAGGNFYYEGVNVIDGNNAAGAMSMDFLRTYLDCYGLMGNLLGSGPDSTQAWGLRAAAFLASSSYGDTISLASSNTNNIRVFNVMHASDVLFTGRRSTKSSGGTTGGLTPDGGDGLPGPPLPVGVSVTTRAGGRVIVLAAPIAHALPKGANSVSRVMAKIFADLGLIH